VKCLGAKINIHEIGKKEIYASSNDNNHFKKTKSICCEKITKKTKRSSNGYDIRSNDDQIINRWRYLIVKITIL